MRILELLPRRVGPKTKLDYKLEDLGSIAALLRLAYFKRLWIIQEVVYNVDVTLIYDRCDLKWVRLAAALGVLEENSGCLTFLRGTKCDVMALRRTRDL
jgi:hypothetical protein